MQNYKHIFSGIEKEELDLKLQSAPSMERKKFRPNFDIR